MNIRIATPADAEAVRDIYAPHVATHTSFEQTAPSTEEIANRITATLQRYPWLVLEDGEAIAGYAYAGTHRARHAYQWSVEASVYVAPTHHRRGVARRLYDALFAALEHQGFINVYAGITLPNDRSVAFHRAMGFEPIGVYRRIGFKNGAWHDVEWSAKRLPAPEGAPPDPRPLPTVVEAISKLVATY